MKIKNLKTGLKACFAIFFMQKNAFILKQIIEQTLHSNKTFLSKYSSQISLEKSIICPFYAQNRAECTSLSTKRNLFHTGHPHAETDIIELTTLQDIPKMSKGI